MIKYKLIAMGTALGIIICCVGCHKGDDALENVISSHQLVEIEMEDQQLRETAGYGEIDVGYPEIRNSCLVEDDKENLYCIGLAEDRTIAIYRLTEEDSWELAKTIVLQEKEEIDIFYDAFIKEGCLYFLIGNRERHVFVIKYQENGQEEKIMLNTDSGLLNADDMTFGEIKVDTEGDIYVRDSNKITRYDGKTGEKHVTYVVASGGLEIVEDKLFATDGCFLSVFNKDTGVNEEQIEYKMGCAEFRLAHDNKGIYIGNDSGISFRNQDIENWEQLLSAEDGYLSSGVPVRKFFMSNDDIIVWFDDDTVKRYSYGKNMQNKKEIIEVLMVTENPYIKKAANEYMDEHPDLMIKFNVTCQNSNISFEEMIQEVNTELLTGGGPDLIVLDGFPIETYIKKGILADITDIIEPLILDGSINEKVVEAFKEADGYHAIPLYYSVPMIWGDKEIIENVHTIEELAAYKKAHPEVILMNKSMPELCGQLFDSCYPSWFQDGKLDTKALETFLKSIQVLAEKPYSEDEIEHICFSTRYYDSKPEEMLDVAYGKTRLFIFEPACPQESRLSASVLEACKGGMVSNILAQGKKPFHCRSILGINKNSKNQEIVKEIIKIALKEENQSKFSVYGNPVNQKAISKLEKELTNIPEIVEDGSGRKVECDQTEMTYYGMACKIQDLADTNLSNYCNSDLYNFIYNEIMAYCKGEKQLDEVMNTINTRTSLQILE